MRAPSFTHDVIIIGQGLAGTVLSATLQQRGRRVVVFDVPLAGRASEVAAGLVNPVVLRRTVLTWRASEMLAIAGAFYRDLGLQYDKAFWHPMPLVAIFPTAQEAGIWELRTKDPETMRFVRMDTSADQALDALPQPYGRGVVDRSAWVDVKALLAAHRNELRAGDALREQRVEAGDIIRYDDGIGIHDCSAPLVVHCAGPFAEVPGLVPVKGEGLTVRIPGLHLDRIVHRGVFLLPLGADVYRVGATFAWDDVWSGPSEEARHYLLDRTERLVEREVEVLDHWCGVRPASKDRRPLLGRIGTHEVVFNGLGSRGVMLAPWCAQQLCGHLLDGAPLDVEVRVERFG
ncbi:MAG: FAD-binding oxidoreductase [Flavobacteriales bacterium]|nr:FAD-binding oxidoreductase [Flavobacteriales bacterium]